MELRVPSRDPRGACGKGIVQRTPNEAFSFQVSTENQEQTDALAADGERAKRAFGAMMTMRQIDVAAIEAAIRG
jgi:predicted 3-demethylubiquinone-9 3-methyltransferase (glyoxalase superfamily)